MKLTMTGADLSHAATWAAALTPRRPSVPELAGVLITATDDALTLAATDLDASGRVAVTAFVREPGRALVSAALLAAIGKLLVREDDVTIETTDKTLLVKVGRSRWELPLIDDLTYPAFPEDGAALGTVDPAVLSNALERVMVAVGDGTSADPMRGGVGLSAAEGEPLDVGTTDRHRLAVAQVPWTSDGDLPSVLVPAGILKAAVTAMRGATEPVTLRSTGETLAFSTTTHTVIGRLLSDSGDAWRKLEARVLGAPTATTATVRTDDLRTVMDRAVVALATDETLAMRVTEDGVTAWRAQGNQGEHHCLVTGFDGDPREFGIKPRYLRDLLDKLDAPVLELEFVALMGAHMIVARPLSEAGERIDGFYMAQAPMKLLAPSTVGAA